MENVDSILEYWFGRHADDAVVAEQQRGLWWSKNEETDRAIAERFESCTTAAACGKLDDWAVSPRGTLALILLTDQFPRNMYRDQPRAFGFDSFAHRWCRVGLAQGFDRMLRPIERVFFYLPLEHAESIEDQDRAVQLFDQLLQIVPLQHKEAFNGFHDFAVRHRDIVARFGRFPHRNEILGRISTEKEIQFLHTPGSAF